MLEMSLKLSLYTLRRAGEEASEYDIGIADVVEFAGLALGLGPTPRSMRMRSLLEGLL